MPYAHFFNVTVCMFTNMLSAASQLVLFVSDEKYVLVSIASEETRVSDCSQPVNY